MDNSAIIKIENLKKQYHLGVIGGATLSADLQSWWANIRGKEDPNSVIGSKKHKKNEKFMALNGINLEIKKGEVVGIIGRNGAGKSTLLKILSRITSPTEGTVFIDGRITSMLEVGTGFNMEMTGRENIYLNGAILGMTKSEVNTKIDEIIEFSECGQFIDTPVKRYSSGMYVKLAFSVAAHLDSEIMIMDEVLAVGDVSFQQKCLGKMRDVANQNGRTILYVSHNMGTIRSLCDRCIVLDKGSVLYDGNVETAIQYYINDFSDMNWDNDLTQYIRPKTLVQRIEMTRLTLCDKEDTLFYHDQKLRFKLIWRALNDIDNTYIRIVFKYQDDTPAGMSSTIIPIATQKGEQSHLEFEIDISLFATGRYSGSIYFYKQDGAGSMDNLDIVDRAFAFEVLNNGPDTNKLQWYHAAWGHCVLPKILITEVNQLL